MSEMRVRVVITPTRNLQQIAAPAQPRTQPFGYVETAASRQRVVTTDTGVKVGQVQVIGTTETADISQVSSTDTDF